MNGQIAGLINSEVPTDKAQVAKIFGPKFQTMAGWRSFVRTALNNTVTDKFRAPLPTWSEESFQALFVACWIHHPVEKGSFMIDMGELPPLQRDVIVAAYNEHCSARKSSHLGKAGRSASNGWAFLQGYKELLVQYELTQGRPYLFLKSEGHTTGLSGIIPHMQSWVHKNKHGVGKLASPALNAIANSASAWSGAIEGRAAENYAKGYGKLLKDVLGLKGTKVTAREMMTGLFQKTTFPAPANCTKTMNNQQLGTILTQYCNAGPLYQTNKGISPDMISDLRQLAQTLQADGEVVMARVYREIRVKPAEIDQSLNVFCSSDG